MHSSACIKVHNITTHLNAAALSSGHYKSHPTLSKSDLISFVLFELLQNLQEVQHENTTFTKGDDGALSITYFSVLTRDTLYRVQAASA
jgi:hypothetical protein